MKTISGIFLAVLLFSSSVNAHTTPPAYYSPTAIQGYLFVINPARIRYITVDKSGDVLGWYSEPFQIKGVWPKWGRWTTGQFMLWKNSPLKKTPNAIPIKKQGIKYEQT